MATKKIKLTLKGADINKEEVSVSEGKFQPTSPEDPPPEAVDGNFQPTPPEDPPPEDNAPNFQPTTPEDPPADAESNPPADAESDTPCLDQERKRKKDFNKKRDIFTTMIGEENLVIPVTSIGKRLKENITKNMSIKLEGKCNQNGYIKKGSVRIVNYSNGLIQNGNVKFKIIYEALVCNPVEGHLIECNVKNVTKAGIRAEVSDYNDVPLVLFIARDHHHQDRDFLSVKEKDNITVRVIASRFELNDKYIAIIGELVKQKKQRKQPPLKFGK